MHSTTKKTFYIDDLNKQLIPYFSPLTDLLEVKSGLTPKIENIQYLSLVSGIDLCTSEKILCSWFDFLKENYDSFNLEGILKRKLIKYPDDINYGLYKNTVNCNTYAIDDYFDEVMTQFKTREISSFYSFINNPENFNSRSDKSSELQATFKNTVLRKISKLGIDWSKKIGVSLRFEVTFKESEITNRQRDEYKPITFSEYGHVKKAIFSNVYLNISNTNSPLPTLAKNTNK
ncbi:hypothetical protein PflCFBP13517_26615 [Pseudomonas fluorescens]|nr:hypothetical protein PflCFBP13517_26615 [Pseudomonas fluorescens]